MMVCVRLCMADLSNGSCARHSAAVKVTRDTTAAEALKMAMDRFNPGDDGTTPYALYLTTDTSGRVATALCDHGA